MTERSKSKSRLFFIEIFDYHCVFSICAERVHESIRQKPS